MKKQSKEQVISTLMQKSAIERAGDLSEYLKLLGFNDGLDYLNASNLLVVQHTIEAAIIDALQLIETPKSKLTVSAIAKNKLDKLGLPDTTSLNNQERRLFWSKVQREFEGQFDKLTA